ncbi:hypothetical protein ALC56_01180 [Trachymyrmex septentrionalis]|uniref:Uncharacterized protein n=1 Tax=Trachymyrmex septentrionalis TaxID=34720 RepID=A0A151K111_9HYME|nr:hypothetical protein ALC56_01180 [Trachymyrmex septentrionalis]
MDRCKHKRNYMDEMYNIICKIESLKPEPEVCNMSCPPLGCPRGPCPGMCYSKGTFLDPCCEERMSCTSSLRPSHRCMSRCLNGNACNVSVRLPYYGCSSINRGNPHNQNGGCSNPHDLSGFQQVPHSSSHNLTSTIFPRCTGSVQCL